MIEFNGETNRAADRPAIRRRTVARSPDPRYLTRHCCNRKDE